MWAIMSAVACRSGRSKGPERREKNLFASLSNSCLQEGYKYRMPLLPGSENTSLFYQRHI